MRERDRRPDADFLESIARKAWLNLNYANAVDLSLLEGRVSPLIMEEISKEDIAKLEKAAEDGKKRVEKAIADAGEMGFANTSKYLEKLQGDLPGQLGLTVAILRGDPKKSAEKIGKITDIINKIQRVEDSFKDAIVLFGNQLSKLPYSQDPEKAAAEAAAAAAEESESGNVEVDGEDLGTTEEVAAAAVTAFKDQSIKDLASNKFMTWVKGIEFPDLGTLEKAAKASYKPADEPKGFLGKLGALVGYGELGASAFAEDLLGAPLSKIIDKAEQWKTAAKEEPKTVGTGIADELQDLGQGDTSVVGGGATGGGGGGGEGGPGGDATVTIDVPGVGDVPAGPPPWPFAPGYDGPPEEAEKMKPVPWDELERTVTAPEDVETITPQLAALINDDPKVDILFIDPEEAKKAAEEAKKKEGEGGTAGSAGGTAGTTSPSEDYARGAEDEGGDMGESAWVHNQPLSNLLFERNTPKRDGETWVHKSSLKQALFTEAIFFKDVAKALKAQGIEDDKLDDYARDLAKRLENQYDVIIKDIPEEAEAPKEDVDAGVEIQQSGITMDDVKDLLKQQGEASKEAMQMVKDILASKDESEVQRALARAEEEGVNVSVAVSAIANSEAVAGSEAEASGGGKPKKKRDRTKPPTDKIKKRGEEVGLEPKEGETGEQFGGRVRKEEEKQGKRTKKPKAKSSAGSKSSSEASVEATITSGYIHRLGTLTEVLIGSPLRVKSSLLVAEESVDEDENQTDRWSKLAGLEDD
tara:strand:+ start:1547 stop:3808 length:2262 start_codon:yes stop_codon:yes gene_type:complete